MEDGQGMWWRVGHFLPAAVTASNKGTKATCQPHSRSCNIIYFPVMQVLYLFLFLGEGGKGRPAKWFWFWGEQISSQFCFLFYSNFGGGVNWAQYIRGGFKQAHFVLPKAGLLHLPKLSFSVYSVIASRGHRLKQRDKGSLSVLVSVQKFSLFLLRQFNAVANKMLEHGR